MNEPLSPEARALVEAVRPAHVPTSDDEARVRRGLDARIVAAGLAGGALMSAGIGKALAVVAVSAAVVGGAVWTTTMRAPAPQPTPPVRTTAPSPPPASSLPRELALLTEAQQALRNGDGAAALAATERHAALFPSGTLMQERAVVRALALCTLGRRTEARALVDDFQRRWPGSPLTDRMRGVCSAPEPSRRRR